MGEKIICSAIWFDDNKKYDHQPKNINGGFIVCDMRHHNCFQTLAILSNDINKHIKFEKEQGFLTTENRFVTREEAAIIAKESNQIDREIYKPYSEDLY